MHLLSSPKNNLHKTWIFHPLFLGLYFALFPFSQNIDELGLDIKFTQVRSLFFIIAIVILLTIFVRWLIKEELRSGIISSIIIIFVFSYGYINTFLYTNLSLDKSYLDYLLMPLWVVVSVVFILWVNKGGRNLLKINQSLNYMSFVLLIFPLYRLVLFTFFTDQTVPQIDLYLNQMREEINLKTNEPYIPAVEEDSLPDIYYIILDGYTRADVLQQYFHYDNTEFLELLHQRGFYVAEHSSSNYSETTASIPSSLNLGYLNDLPDFLQSKNPKLDNFRYLLSSMSGELIEKGLVIHFLKQNGYKIISFDSGFEYTSLESVDVYKHSSRVKNRNLNTALELIILDSTIGGFFRRLSGENFVPAQTLYDDHRERILYTLENLPLKGRRSAPRFVLAHIICPHPPYVFNAVGEPIYNSDPYTLADFTAGGSWSPELYRDQVEFINQRIMVVIDEIISKSSIPPIIILQGDHSHRTIYLEKMPDEAEFDRLFPILNAYLLPNQDNAQLYPSISPVNSFRVVFNSYFGTKLDFLPDEQFVFNGGTSQDFVNTCEVFNCENSDY